MDTSNLTPSLANLIQHLRLYKPPQDEEDGGDDVGSAQSTAGPARFTPKRAAVLVCLFEDEVGQLRVILTKRSSTHPGEVSLPGGKAEEGDADDIETALRSQRGNRVGSLSCHRRRPS